MKNNLTLIFPNPMKHYFLPTVLVYLISTVLCNAQVLKGTITDVNGDPIPYSTVYIQELKQGTTANSRGFYELKLGPGRYMVTFQSLGYSPVMQNITITGSDINKDVSLPRQYYEIPEVRITATGEDPAFGIIRKAISMASYYLNNVSYYKADVYLKGNIVFNKIPKLLQKSMTISTSDRDSSTDEEKRIREGDAFMVESFNEIEFTAPDKYVQKVISINSTLPDQESNLSPMDFINASFYQPLVAGIAISPLSPQAFSYYRFKYQGATPQGNNIINKIQVIPRMKSQQLFEGTIYIIEDLWCIHSVDLTNENIAGRIEIQQIYVPVQNDIWMPVSHNFHMEISILGVKAEAGYGSSVKYLNVSPDKNIRRPGSFTETVNRYPSVNEVITQKEASKNQQKINEIMEKDKLTNRDVMAISRLMNKELEKNVPDSIRNNLEIKDNITRTVEKDAGNRDSTYWSQVRPIPLSDVEIRSLNYRDSVMKDAVPREPSQPGITVTLKAGNPPRDGKFRKAINAAGFGHTWSDTSGFSFRHEGLFDLKNLNFNTVDGFTYGQDFRISKSWENRKVLTISPGLSYAFSRQKLMWRVNSNYRFGSEKQQQIFFRTGSFSRDIGTGGSINTLINSFTSLFMKRNYIKLYESNYLTFGYRSELINGLNIELSGGYEGRRVLQNNTSFSFVKSSREYSDNIPGSMYLDSASNPVNMLRDQDHFYFNTSITFTPRQRYRLSDGARIPQGSDWPTFTFSWKHVMNEIEGDNSYRHFDVLRFEVTRTHEMGAFSELTWRVRTGGIPDNRYISFYDFFHFNAQPLPLLFDNYTDAFRLAPYYSISTPEFFGEVHTKYTTPYLFLKYLPGLSKTLMRENVSIAYLGSRFHPDYTEVGYSISEIWLIGELGFWLGFEDMDYSSSGVRLILRFNGL